MFVSNTTAQIHTRHYNEKMRPKYKALFYDWDGCIAKTIHIWLAAYKQVLADENIFPEDHEIIELFGNWDAPKILGHSDIEKATKKVLDYVHDKVSNVETYADSIETIKKLHDKGIKIAVITSSKCKTIQRTAAYEELKPFVDLLVCADDVENHKPHPEVIEQGMTKLDLKPEDILMIGDSDKDLGAANNAGVDSALFAPDANKVFHDHEELKNAFHPTHIFTQHTDVLQLV